MRGLFAVTVWFLLCGFAFGVDGPSDAVVWAARDKAAFDIGASQHFAYIWLHNERENGMAGVVAALNYISKSRVSVVTGDPSEPGTALLENGRLLRVNLLQMAPKLADYARFRALWDSLIINEPYFYVMGEGTKEIEAITVCGAPIAVLKERIFGPHILKTVPEAANVLLPTDENGNIISPGSLAPILRADWFVKTVLTTLDGGRYYDFLGLTKDTTQAQYLASRGASEEQVAALGSDERAALIRSKITGKPRRIDIFRSAGVRPSAGTGLVAITHDIFDEDVLNPAFDPIRTLIDGKDRAREVILEKANGWHEFTLWDGEGRLVDSAPDNVAADHRIPEPHTKRLQPAMSCIRCHADEEGWKPFINDVHTITQHGFDIFGKVGDPNQLDTLQRLAGLYSGDLSLALLLGRNSYSDVAFRTTETIYGIGSGLTVPAMSQAVAGLHDSYEYELVTSEMACLELGIDPGDTPDTTLALAMPRTQPVDGISIEDPIVRLLAVGLAVNRRQFELSYTNMSLRSIPFVVEQRTPKNEIPIEEPPKEQINAEP